MGVRRLTIDDGIEIRKYKYVQKFLAKTKTKKG